MLRLCSGVAGIHVPPSLSARRPNGRLWSARSGCRRDSRPGPSLSGGDRVPVVQPADVSPGFTSRPSLSGLDALDLLPRAGHVSPGFTSRPS